MFLIITVLFSLLSKEIFSPRFGVFRADSPVIEISDDSEPENIEPMKQNTKKESDLEITDVENVKENKNSHDPEKEKEILERKEMWKNHKNKKWNELLTRMGHMVNFIYTKYQRNWKSPQEIYDTEKGKMIQKYWDDLTSLYEEFSPITPKFIKFKQLEDVYGQRFEYRLKRLDKFYREAAIPDERQMESHLNAIAWKFYNDDKNFNITFGIRFRENTRKVKDILYEIKKEMKERKKIDQSKPKIEFIKKHILKLKEYASNYYLYNCKPELYGINHLYKFEIDHMKDLVKYPNMTDTDIWDYYCLGKRYQLSQIKECVRSKNEFSYIPLKDMELILQEL